MRKAVLLSTLASIMVLTGCPDSGSDICLQNCPPLDGATDGTLDAARDVSIDAPIDCDLTKDPKDSLSCIDDGVGVFVSPTGSETNPGTKALPVKTLGTALTKLGGKPRIYMCEGNYPGSVEIKTSVAIYGALKCDWTAGGARPVIQADKPAFGLQLEAANISLIDIEVDGADGVADGESSVGVFANAASGAALTRVKVIAGNGKNGKPGTTGSNYTPVAQNDPSIAGKNASGVNGGPIHVCALCSDGKNSVGGAAGTGGALPTDGQDGQPNLNGVNPIDGKKGHAKPSVDCTGHDGPTGDAGVPATSNTALATLTTSWLPTSGSSGTNAGPAQGGGGGGGGIDGTNTSGGGGGGGCGGCGGAAGTGGTGGGASIGLLSLSSTVTLVTSEITTKQAGNGGPGGVGQAGQAGGFSGQNNNPGCSGGTGGTGGLGGSGSGGAGGLSAPIVFKGTAPTIDIATTGKLTPGTKGTKGTGGTPGTNDGPDGLSQPSFECKTPLCN